MHCQRGTLKQHAHSIGDGPESLLSLCILCVTICDADNVFAPAVR